MLYRLLADVVVLLHGAFILFVVGGVVFVARWRRLLPAHLLCVAWGAWSEFTGTVCPLTPLENQFRQLAGNSGYQGGFIEHYLIPVIYPAGLTSELQTGLGLTVIAVNGLGYGWLWHRWQRRRAPPGN